MMRGVDVQGGNPTNNPVAVFYNLYIPPNDSGGQKLAYNILAEQMAQVNESGVYGCNATIYYLTIGQPFETNFMNGLCDNYQFQCAHINHFKEGHEMLTQQSLLDYCKQEQNIAHTVSYIHNKGSFHSSEGQNHVRRMLTGQALSQECIQSVDSTKCNVCGANFKSVWGPTYWGTMWSAKCEYVRKLVSPFKLEEKNKEAVNTRPKEMMMNFYSDQSSRKFALGEGRYAAEQFVATHPSLVPCSFMPPKQEFWSVDPPGSFKAHVIPLHYPKWNETMEGNNHLKEWYFLPGVLWRYHVLYGELPPANSWVWRHYPDGRNWQIAIENMGFLNALYHLLQTA